MRLGGIGQANFVLVFKLSGEDWIQRGDDLYGDAAKYDFGYSVAISDDGSVVIMGAPGDGASKGCVRVYEWKSKDGSEAWTPKGDTINGEGAYDGESGYSVTMNRDGSVIGIGAPRNNGNVTCTDSGHVQVFKFKNGSWGKRGQDIDGDGDYESSGWSISLDWSGATIAIGAPGNDRNGRGSDHTRVYYWDESISIWVQRGKDIDGGESINDKIRWQRFSQ